MTAGWEGNVLGTAPVEPIRGRDEIVAYRLRMRREDGAWRIHRLLAGYDVPFLPAARR